MWINLYYIKVSILNVYSWVKSSKKGTNEYTCYLYDFENNFSTLTEHLISFYLDIKNIDSVTIYRL